MRFQVPPKTLRVDSTAGSRNESAVPNCQICVSVPR